MEFRVLGPLEVEVDGRPAEHLGPLLRRLLVLLLIDAGQVIPAYRLAELLWDDDSPATHTVTLRTHVNHLRDALEPQRQPRGPSVIVTETDGYRLVVPRRHVDAERFRTLYQEGLQAWDDRDVRRARVRLRAALDLWQGEVLPDMSSLGGVGAFRLRLEQQREAASELLIEADLELGRHRDVLPELEQLVAASPTNERFRLLLALAAYRSGQIGRAADICREGIILLRRSGLSSPDLEQQQQDILNRAATLELVSLPPGSPLVPQPPPAPADFIDRDAVLGELTDQLKTSWDSEHAAVVLMTGMGGVGKTSTALSAAAQASGWFPDGVAYLDLRGMRGQPRQPGSALTEMLRLIGIPEAPASPDERECLLQEQLSGRRLLMVLDDAATVQQVRRLLPRRGPCAAIITSRAPLADLDVTSKITLDVLDPRSAEEYLVRHIPDSRVAQEPGAIGRIADLCGYLPLALKITGSILAGTPHRSLARQRERLERNRLDALQHERRLDGDSSESAASRGVRATLELSYRTLAEPGQRAFRMLGVLQAPAISAWTAASLLDCTLEEAEDIMDGLASASLVDALPRERGGTVSYRLHVLIQELAREKAARDGDAGPALVRALRSYLWLARRAGAALDPDADAAADVPRWAGSSDVAAARARDAAVNQPAAWFTDHRDELVAAVHTAHQAGEWRLTWQLTSALVPIFDLLAATDDWEATHALAQDAATRSGDAPGSAWTLCGLGLLRRYQGRLADAAGAFAVSERVFAAEGVRFGQARALCGYGDILVGQARFAEASVALSQGRELFRDLGKRAGEASAMASLGEVYGQQGIWDQAAGWSGRSIDLSRGLNDRRALAGSLRDLGVACRQLGNLAQAEDAFRECLSIYGQLGDRRGTAAALVSYGKAQDAQRTIAGRAQARHKYHQAAAIFAELGDQRWEALTYLSLGTSYQDDDSPAEALPYLGKAVTGLRRGQEQHVLASALRLRSQAHSQVGDAAHAQEDRREAEEIPGIPRGGT